MRSVKVMAKLYICIFLASLWTTAEAMTFAWETRTEYNSGPSYGWSYTYDIGYYNNTLMIDLDINLVGYDPGVNLRNRWESGIESIWSTSRFTTPISFNVDWQNTDYDYTVTVAAGTGRWSMVNWFTVGASGWGDSYQEEVAAHEFGHMIGLWDEYAGGAVNPLTGLINTSGLMCTLDGPTLDWYYAPFLSWYEDKMTSVNVVPLPTSVLLLGTGLVGVALYRIRMIGVAGNQDKDE